MRVDTRKILSGHIANQYIRHTRMISRDIVAAKHLRRNRHAGMRWIITELALTAAVAGIPGTKPSSSTESRVIAAMMRWGPASAGEPELEAGSGGDDLAAGGSGEAP
jgi:hypothetical protein